MKSIQRSVDHFHLPEMRKMMLGAGSRSGISDHLHCQTGQDQRIHQLLAAFFVTLCDINNAGTHSPERHFL